MVKVVHCFTAVDMRMGHTGLEAYAKTRKVHLNAMDEETACIFISRNRCRMKAYSYNGVVSYMRAPSESRPFDLNAIDEFPRAFDKNGKMDYSRALKMSLEKMMALKGYLPEKSLG